MLPRTENNWYEVMTAPDVTIIAVAKSRWLAEDNFYRPTIKSK